MCYQIAIVCMCYQVAIMKAQAVNAAYVRGDVREPGSCAEVVAAAVKQATATTTMTHTPPYRNHEDLSDPVITF